MGKLQRHDLTFTASATSDKEVNLREKELVAILVDGTMAGTAFTMTGQYADDDTPATAKTFRPVKDGAGAAVTITAASNTYVTLTQAQNFATQGLVRMKLVSTTTETMTVTLIVRDMA